MLAKLQTVLNRAQRGKYAVGAFNISNLEQLQAVLTAADKLRSPVIINTSEKALAYSSPGILVTMTRTLAARSRVPVVLNLDHGHHVPAATACLRAGWTGIMFDGSKLPYEKNVALTARVKALARPYGVGVEGEIGQVKYKEDLVVSAKPVLATPEQAVDFVRRTRVDALAIGIGNSHGLPVPHEKLHFDLLKKIRRVVSVPLVLHGASGTSAAHIRRAIQLGISKINIDTDLRLAFTRSIRVVLRDRNVIDPRDYLGSARQAVMETVMEKMILFGSKGRTR